MTKNELMCKMMDKVVVKANKKGLVLSRMDVRNLGEHLACAVIMGKNDRSVDRMLNKLLTLIAI